MCEGRKGRRREDRERILRVIAPLLTALSPAAAFAWLVGFFEPPSAEEGEEMCV